MAIVMHCASTWSGSMSPVQSVQFLATSSLARAQVPTHRPRQQVLTLAKLVGGEGVVVVVGPRLLHVHLDGRQLGRFLALAGEFAGQDELLQLREKEN